MTLELFKYLLLQLFPSLTIFVHSHHEPYIIIMQLYLMIDYTNILFNLLTD